ncbi:MULTISPECIES: DNA recombination protein RmuC [Acetobacter]|uniref:DNA recombination protein RmuC homolog n=2 Tax=Acetobacter TaxID=434 RepID=A0A5B9GGX7_9PROT|nr:MULTISPECIES: DNA recombination protein RmuC [Acetobacter]GBR57128.1 DNA recombinase RmuC [Acetobacter senegalensis DSM 18889]AKR48952.1 DNA polymerase [Acetobacter pasteurianus]ARW46681.1 DNA recombination protein RmuC like protein [Acetobacter pasteurianus subsp. pasteurianus]MCP1201520.1 DNA recombination protein RmuC [Acetobacter oryzoeni]QEE84957.1 DNA recombination protein RmuC [Acetobacter oryzoeni]
MSSIIVLLSVAVCALLLGAGLTILLRPKSGGGTDADLLARLYVLVEREAATARSDIAAQRNSMVEMERAMGGRIERMRTELAEQLGALAGGLGREQAEARAAQAEALRNLADTSAQQLASIRRAVTEQLHEAVEQQMQTSFQRVLEQFSAMQKAMGEVRAMTGQIGDLKRLFSNVKTRGGWGEAQLRAILDDVLPPGTYESNVRIGNGNDVVEFAIRMPVKSSTPPLLPVDSKFPTEAYERLLNAADEGDTAAEKAARKSLENTMRLEARKISSKYIHPPKTVEFAVLYLPTDGLYTEVARMPGLIDDLGRQFRVMVMGPALMPAMLRTIHLGYVTLALEERTETIARLLGATRQEMIKMDGVLDKLARNAQAMSFSIEEARRRTRSVSRKLRELDEPEDNAAGTEESEIEFTGVDSNGTASG